MCYVSTGAILAILSFGIATPCTYGQVNRPQSSTSTALGKVFGTEAPAIDLATSENDRVKAYNLTTSTYDRALRYNDTGLPKLYDSRTGQVRLHTEFVNEFKHDPLPVSTADVVVVARVTSAQAHLSADGSRVFSSFTLAPSSYLKGNRQAQTLQADRLGGVVILPNGKRHYVGVANKGLPQINQTYLLFLQKTSLPGTYEILTGYALTGDRVSALDSDGDLNDQLDKSALLRQVKESK